MLRRFVVDFLFRNCSAMLLGQGGPPWQGNIGQGHRRWNGIGKEPHFQPTGQKSEKKSDRKLQKSQN